MLVRFSMTSKKQNKFSLAVLTKPPREITIKKIYYVIANTKLKP